jgi:hypothetical protein
LANRKKEEAMADTVNSLLNSNGEGGSLTIEFNGKKYTAGLITQRIKAEFEKKLEKKALDAVYSLKSHLEPVEFREAISGVTRDIATGIYSFGSDNSVQAMTTPWGGIVLASLIFNTTEDEVQALMLSEREKFETVMQLVREKSFPNAKKE